LTSAHTVDPMTVLAVRRLLACCVLVLAGLAPASAADVLYPLGSRIGLAPPPGITLSSSFPGFEDSNKRVYIRLVAMPQQADAEIEKSMTNETLKKQGITVEKRESITVPSGKGMLIVARQQAQDVHFHKWMMIAPIGDLTALISFEIRDDVKDAYPEQVIRAT